MGQASSACCQTYAIVENDVQPFKKQFVAQKRSVNVLGSKSQLVLSSHKERVIKLQKVPCDGDLVRQSLNGLLQVKSALNMFESSKNSSTTIDSSASSLAKNLFLSSSSVGQFYPILEIVKEEESRVSAIDWRSTSFQCGYQTVVETYIDSSLYEGEKQNGKRQGHGKYTFPNGAVYEGSWKNDVMQGKGTLFNSNGINAYQGEFKDNQFCGFGYLNNPSYPTSTNTYVRDPNKKIAYFEDFATLDNWWKCYEGEFKADQKHGRGRLYFPNGDFIIADFYKDVISGDVVLFKADHTIIHGYWRNNKLIRINAELENQVQGHNHSICT